MRIHRHEPIRGVDPIIAAPCAHVGVTREDCAVQHEHVLAKHEHATVRRARIRQPACAGAFAAHGLGEIDGGMHFHLHFVPAVLVMRRLTLIAPSFDVERWVLDVRRSPCFSGTSFIPHFGQFPG